MTRLYIRFPISRHVGFVWTRRLGSRRPSGRGCGAPGCASWLLFAVALLIVLTWAVR